MDWIKAVQSDSNLNEAVRKDLDKQLAAYQDALSSAQSWEKTLQLQGKVIAMRDLIGRFTQREKESKHAGERSADAGSNKSATA